MSTLTRDEIDAVGAVCAAANLQGCVDADAQDGLLIDGRQAPFSEGLAVIADTVDFDMLEECGYITAEQVETLIGLFERFGVAF